MTSSSINLSERLKRKLDPAPESRHAAKVAKRKEESEDEEEDAKPKPTGRKSLPPRPRKKAVIQSESDEESDEDDSEDDEESDFEEELEGTKKKRVRKFKTNAAEIPFFLVLFYHQLVSLLAHCLTIS